MHLAEYIDGWKWQEKKPVASHCYDQLIMGFIIISVSGRREISLINSFCAVLGEGKLQHTSKSIKHHFSSLSLQMNVESKL